jgi:hypothetical protein
MTAPFRKEPLERERYDAAGNGSGDKRKSIELFL